MSLLKYVRTVHDAGRRSVAAPGSAWFGKVGYHFLPDQDVSRTELLYDNEAQLNQVTLK